MPLQATSGAASYDGFGGGPAAVPNYIEDVFSTYLYTGSGSTQTINNGIDLAGKGGLVWIKNRTTAVTNNCVYDTDRGAGKYLITEGTNAQITESPARFTAFNTNGFSLNTTSFDLNRSAENYASWTFRKQPKFFDVVTYTGNGSTQAISHSLGSVPGCIIAKRTNTTGSWRVFHRSVSTQYGNLNSTGAFQTTSAENVWGNNSTTVAPTSTQFTVGNDSSLNASGSTYVAYLFAHDAGGFGLTGADNVISCGSFTTDANGQATVSLGYEPQWVMVKNTAVSSSGTAVSWNITDNMRGMPVGGVDPRLFANTSDAEDTTYDWVSPTATGFVITPNVSSGDTFANSNYIYIAIRRGPMKTPTTGTSVFDRDVYTGSSAARNITSGFPVDLAISKNRTQTAAPSWFDRLRGALLSLASSSFGAENTQTDTLTGFDSMTGVALGPDTNLIINTSPDSYVLWTFRRAPGFFDIVCYSGTGANRTVSHNLGVVPELMFVKIRNASEDWAVYSANLLNTQYMKLNTTAAAATGTTWWNSTTPTANNFSLGTAASVNTNGGRYINYLFASCPGVSKVGSYTGTGATLQIDCGFTGGARFVLIKRTDSSGGWYCWDSSRGIVSGNDPYLLLNSTAAEVTNTDYIDTYSAGFEISSTAPAAINANGGSFVFLAIS